MPIGQIPFKLNVSLKAILLMGHQDDAHSAWLPIHRTNHTHVKLLARRIPRRNRDSAGSPPPNFPPSTSLGEQILTPPPTGVPLPIRTIQAFEGTVSIILFARYPSTRLRDISHGAAHLIH